MKKRLLIWVVLALLATVAGAQELNCNVSINSDKIEGSSKEVFESLRRAITEFLNTNKWTNLTYGPTERIDCNLMILVNSVSESNEYVCEATIQASRPVFNTTYTTNLLNIKDKEFTFTYSYEQLTYQQNTFTTNLTAMLAYYVYLILGVDADSYARLGGTPYFQACEDIVSVCQTASGLTEAEQSGWQYSRSGAGLGAKGRRYVMVNELMDENFKPYRNFFYEYHRLCLDEMQANVANARARIAEGLKVLREINKNRSTNIIIPMFLDAKVDELVNIFHGGTPQEKTDVYDLLMALDPTRSNTYELITRD